MHVACHFAAVVPDDGGYQSIFLWSLVLIVLLLILLGAYSFLKRWMKSADEPMATGFTLSDLRELHRQGKMSSEEFELARAKMVASAKRMTEKMPAVMPRRTPPSSSAPDGSGLPPPGA